MRSAGTSKSGQVRTLQLPMRHEKLDMHQVPTCRASLPSRRRKLVQCCGKGEGKRSNNVLKNTNIVPELQVLTLAFGC
jgi:hypothetical protein